MTVEKIICDECGRVKAEANHWHKVGIYSLRKDVTVTCGFLRGPEAITAGDNYEVHDLCGEQCFHKHIAKLLGFNPPNEVSA